MKPEHLQWIDRIWEIVDQATDAVLRGREIGKATDRARAT
jgi:hypothetical protein